MRDADLTSPVPPSVGSGCLGSVVLGVVYLVGAMLFIVALVLILGVFVVAILAALVALGINRLLVAISPRYRERRVAQGTFQPTTRVIDTTARVIDSAKPKRRS
jgi:VIT1/CCC1 family predicted Fe2+/Mn2+ transporter